MLIAKNLRDMTVEEVKTIADKITFADLRILADAHVPQCFIGKDKKIRENSQNICAVLNDVMRRRFMM